MLLLHFGNEKCILSALFFNLQIKMPLNRLGNENNISRTTLAWLELNFEMACIVCKRVELELMF